MIPTVKPLAFRVALPANIATIHYTYEMQHGVYTMIPLDCEADAAYYANGKQAYFYNSPIQGMFLFVPVMS